MRILLVNGSPRKASANSRILLDGIRSRLGEGQSYRMVEAMNGRAMPADLDVDFIVLAFPLYIDCLHSKLVAWLLSYEELLRSAQGQGETKDGIGLVALANNGFYEGVQNKSALAIVEHFCARAGLEWKGGLGVGTGEMLSGLKSAPGTMLVKKPVSRALDEMAARIRAGGEPAGNRYVQHAFPWFAFELAADIRWRREARSNGVSLRAMRARPLTRPLA